MQDYKTVTEKADEWDISSRHVQYLCRSGKISGAVKRAGTWFIPAGTPSPAKNTKSDAAGFDFVGTKKQIFSSAIKLFLLGGFDNVSLRDIADNVGIRQSTIYNHFKSKQEILDTIYNYYCFYYLKDRTSLEDMEYKLQNESIMEIMKSIRYEFKEDYLQEMSDITKIIFQRISIDGRAKEIAQTLVVDEGIKYVETVFNRAVEIGRIAAFDVHAIAVLINSIRISMLYYWIIDSSSENMMKLMEDEQTLYNHAVGFLTDLKIKE